jgi:hypothetical protein
LGRIGRSPHRNFIIALVLVLFVFWIKALFQGTVSIKFDTADIHYTHLKYLADALWHGDIPWWNPYIFSGFPFLAHPEIGAFYLPNWLLLIVGVTNKTIIWQMFGHTLFAGISMYFLAHRFTGSRLGGLVAGLAFALNGWFIGHTSHLGMFQTASWLPLIILGAHHLLEQKRRFFWTVVTGVALSQLVLAGHFQTALYSVTLFVVFAIGFWLYNFKQNRVRYPLTLAVVALIAVGLSAVQLLPTLQLAGISNRAEIDLAYSQAGSFTPGESAAFFIPNFFGNAQHNPFLGVNDVTQSYLYIGILVVGCTLLGLFSRLKYKWLLIGSGVISFLYLLGSYSFIQEIFFRLIPGFNKIKGPNHALIILFFIVALLAAYGIAGLMDKNKRRGGIWIPVSMFGLAAAIATGLKFSAEAIFSAKGFRIADFPYGNEFTFAWTIAFIVVGTLLVWWYTLLPKRWKLGLLLLLMIVDLGYQATWGNKGFFAKHYQLVIPAQRALAEELSDRLAPGERYDDSDVYAGKVGLNQQELHQIDSIGGYSAIRVAGYDDYWITLEKNKKLRGALNVRLLVDADGKITENSEPSLFAFFPAAIEKESDLTQQLATLDPLATALVPSDLDVAAGAGTATLTAYKKQSIELAVQADKAGLLVIGKAWYPGWQASANNEQLEVVRVDGGLTGVIVPVGNYDLTLRYLPSKHFIGLAVSLMTAGLVGFVLWRKRGRKAA